MCPSSDYQFLIMQRSQLSFLGMVKGVKSFIKPPFLNLLSNPSFYWMGVGKHYPNRTSGQEQFFLNQFQVDGVIRKHHQARSGDGRRNPVLSSQIQKKFIRSALFLRTRRGGMFNLFPSKKLPHTVLVNPPSWGFSFANRKYINQRTFFLGQCLKLLVCSLRFYPMLDELRETKQKTFKTSS